MRSALHSPDGLSGQTKTYFAGESPSACAARKTPEVVARSCEQAPKPENSLPHAPRDPAWFRLLAADADPAHSATHRDFSDNLTVWAWVHRSPCRSIAGLARHFLLPTEALCCVGCP